MHTEAEAVWMVGTVFDWSDSSPESLAPVSISFVLLEQLEVFQENNTISYHHHVHLFEVGLLCVYGGMEYSYHEVTARPLLILEL